MELDVVEVGYTAASHGLSCFSGLINAPSKRTLFGVLNEWDPEQKIAWSLIML